MAQEFTDELLATVKKKLEVTRKHAAYFARMAAEEPVSINEPVDMKKLIQEREWTVADTWEDIETEMELEPEKLKPDVYQHLYTDFLEKDSNDPEALTYYGNQAEKMNNCLNFWDWDRYDINKVMDLQKVNRCMSRFCPNCRKIDLNISMNKFGQALKEVSKDYDLYPHLMTLTVPNVTGDLLEPTIRRMGKAFTKFWTWLYKPNSGAKRKGFVGRIFKGIGAIRVLEITTRWDQKQKAYVYHPHFHIMFFTEKTVEHDLMERRHDGPYRRISQDYVLFSDVELQIMKLWKIAYDGLNIRSYNKMPDSWFDEQGNYSGLYICNFEIMTMPDGIYEVFKYFFKDSDIRSFEQFQTVVNSVYRKRLRQGHGIFFNVKIDETVNEALEKEKEETLEEFLLASTNEIPVKTITGNLKSLTIKYHDYRKISRFKVHKGLGDKD